MRLSSSSLLVVLQLSLLSFLAFAQGPSCSTQVSGPYNISLCPLPSTLPPPQTNPTTLVYSYTSDGTAPRIQLPFSFHLFGSPWDRVYIPSNGILQFGATAFYGSVETIPALLQYSDALPMVAPFWNFFFVNTTVGNVTWSVEGTAPSRSFVVRFNHIIYYQSSPASGNAGSDSSITFDAVLYEGVQGGSTSVTTTSRTPAMASAPASTASPSAQRTTTMGRPTQC